MMIPTFPHGIPADYPNTAEEKSENRRLRDRMVGESRKAREAAAASQQEVGNERVEKEEAVVNSDMETDKDEESERDGETGSEEEQDDLDNLASEPEQDNLRDEQVSTDQPQPQAQADLDTFMGGMLSKIDDMLSVKFNAQRETFNDLRKENKVEFNMIKSEIGSVSNRVKRIEQDVRKNAR